MNILCKLGVHRWALCFKATGKKASDEFLEIAFVFALLGQEILEHRCTRCGKVRK